MNDNDPPRPEPGQPHSAQNPESSVAKHAANWNRRRFIASAGAAVGVGLAGGVVWNLARTGPSASVVVLKADAYDQRLATIIRDGLKQLGISRSWVRNKSVLLKPNLVEPSTQAPHINTHPLVVLAAIEVFRGWDAREVIVAEGQGHCRDTYLVLEQSGFRQMLKQANVEFVDLNHDDVYQVHNRFGAGKLSTLMLPQSLRRAELLVSMPKMKTHHWAGATLSMKNLFGVMPGICYGWPKNVLHHNGIPQSIVDITAAVRPHLAIVDGIVGMEGDGPIMGQPVPSNVLVLGTNLPAVDATAARIMGLNPYKLPYLRLANRRLGVINSWSIQQRGEPIASVQRSFRLLDHPLMQQFRT